MVCIAWVIGLITGIGIFCINDSGPDTYYRKGYDDGFKDAFEYIKDALEKRKVK